MRTVRAWIVRSEFDRHLLRRRAAHERRHGHHQTGQVHQRRRLGRDAGQRHGHALSGTVLAAFVRPVRQALSSRLFRPQGLGVIGAERRRHHAHAV